MEQKQGNIAYCIPTYNHPDTIRDVLEKSAALYKEYGIDIYIYDSSEERDTEDIVNKFICLGYNNIFYVQINYKDNKTKKIFMQYGWKKTYKYLWLVKDRNCFGEKTLQKVLGDINDGSDLVFLPLISSHPTENKDIEINPYYTDAAEFYKDWGWLCTSMDVCIFYVPTIMIKLEQIYMKYRENEMRGFQQCIVLWENLSAKKDNVKIRIIPKEDIQVYQSPYSTSGWRKQRFEVLKTWIDANDSLPECYQKYSGETIKEFAALPWILGSVDELVDLKKDKFLNKEVYAMIEPVWNRLVNIPIEWLYLIVNERYFELKREVLKQVEILIEKKKYEQAYQNCCANTWIENYDNDLEYKLLNKFFVIYQKEKDEGNQNTIFYHVSSYEDMKNKYFLLKHLLWRIEYEIGDNEEFHLLEYMREYKVSDAFLIYLISESCVNKDKVVNLLMKNKE